MKPSDFSRRRLQKAAAYEQRVNGLSWKTAMQRAMQHLSKDVRHYSSLLKEERKMARKTTRKMKRQTNPHLRSGRWEFVGMFAKADIGSVKRILKIHGIKAKVTKDHLKGERGQRELYVERKMFDLAYRAITRLYEVMRAA